MASESLSFDVFWRDHGTSTGMRELGRQASDASGNVRGLADRLDKLGSRAVTARVGLDGNKEANAQLDAIDVKLIRLGKRAANPNINLEGQARVLAEISAVDVALDKLGRKTSRPGINTWGGLAGRVLPSFAGGGAGGSVESALGSGGSGGGGLVATPLAASGSVGALAAGLAALPFIAQAASGGIVAALGTGLAGIAVIGAAKSKAVKASFADLAKSANYDLVQIGKPFRPVLVSVLNTAETVLAELEPVFKGAAKIIAGPFKDFATSLAKSFAQPAVAASIKAVASAFGGILKALAPQLPGDIADIATGITRIANTIKSNPRAFADFISFLFKAAGFGLSMIAALSAAANYIEKHFIPAMNDIRGVFDTVRHETAVIFDGIRHEIAHVWDQIFENSIGMLIRLGHNVATQFNSLRHETAVIFDGVRHDIAHIWDMIWNNTVGRVRRGISDVIGWFKGLPGRALGALSGLGHQLWQYGSFVLGQFWSGLKNIWGTVWGWFKGLPHQILKAMGFGSPPGWAIQAGKDVMHGLLIGIGLTQGKVLNTAGKIGNQLGGAFGSTGAQSGSAAVAQSFAASILPRGWSFPALLSLWNQESGWNAYAVNPSSGAAGIPQALGHGNVFALGDYKAQIEWGLSYIAQRYGNSQAAWAHEQAFNWYDQGGWLPPGLSLAVNRTGRPERILSPRESAGGTVNINVSVPPTVNPRDAGRQVAQLILAHTKSGGMLYPAGATPR